MKKNKTKFPRVYRCYEKKNRSVRRDGLSESADAGRPSSEFINGARRRDLNVIANTVDGVVASRSAFRSGTDAPPRGTPITGCGRRRNVNFIRPRRFGDDDNYDAAGRPQRRFNCSAVFAGREPVAAVTFKKKKRRDEKRSSCRLRSCRRDGCAGTTVNNSSL